MVEIRTLRVGGYIKIDDEPCKINSIDTGKAGKHGSAKARIEAIGIFDGKKRSIVKPVTADVDVPLILKKKGQVISVSEDIAQVMDLETYEMFDLSIPREKELKEGDEILYIEIEGRKAYYER
ncbi:MAG: translation initiation factor IF-5A [Candidatus Aenigmarchaeota archaeon ex4484_56]|nr:MAG: translation initiation factor IF-5A [Candidatus Aenigmarchaeota archaeon ex4484_56]